MAKRIAVGMSQWSDGERGDLLEARDVGGGIVVVLSDTHAGKGYMGHFGLEDEMRLKQMLKTAECHAKKPEDILLWYGGGAYVPPKRYRSGPVNDDIRYLRVHVSRMLMGRGFISREPTWLRAGQMLTARLIAGTAYCALPLQT